MTSIDLNTLGFDRLLATGQLTAKVKIKVSKASSQAIEKVKKAGGEVVVAKQE